MKTAAVSTPARATVSPKGMTAVLPAKTSHRQAQDSMIAAFERSGDTAAAAKLRAFYAKHPLRSPRKGRPGVVEGLHQDRDERAARGRAA